MIGSILRDNTVADEVLLILRGAEDFYHDDHQRIFAAAIALRTASRPIDLVTLAEELHRRGQINDIGGYGKIADLWDAAPTAANAAHYAAIVREQSVLRELIAASTETLREGYDPPSAVGDVLDSALARFCGVADRLHRSRDHGIGELVEDAAQRLDARANAEDDGTIPTHLGDLDGLICGLRPSELTIVAARPSIGKTSLAVHLAVETAKGGVCTLFVSLEQSRQELADRIWCRESGVDSHRVREARFLNEEEIRALNRSKKEFREVPLRIDDAADQSVLRMAAAARRMRTRNGLGLVVVDYLQLVAPEDRRIPRHEQVAALSRRFKLLAKELNCPVVVLAQLNRASEERTDGKPRLSDLRESGSIEADADAVWLLSRIQGQPEAINLDVAKNRNGRTGDVALTFDRARMRWRSYVVSPFPAGNGSRPIPD